MVADTASCFCPTCQAVCTGKFPACSKVWARGPQAVPLRAKALGPPAALSLTANSHGHRRSSVNGSATNGSHETDAVSHLLPALPSGGPRDVNALLEEIRLLRRQIEHSNATAGATGEGADLQAYFAATNALLETLPDRIAAAIEASLTKQHRMIVKDVENSLRQFAGRLARITPPAR
jgi:hypothetical protein